jgi:hypothetical protein
MRALLLALILSTPAIAQVPAVPPIGALCLPTQASFHTQVNPSTGNTVVTLWCDLTSGLYHYSVSGNTANWMQAQCLSTIEPLSVSTVWLQHAWAACVTTTMNASDQAFSNRLLFMWIPRPTVLGVQQVRTLNANGTLGSQLSVAGVAQTIDWTAQLGGIRVPSGTASPRYCSVSGYASLQGVILPSNTFALCTLIYPPQGGFQFQTSADGVSLQAPTDAILVDAHHHVWSIDANNVITVDGIEDSTSANVVSIIYVGGYIWQHNQSGLWWSKPDPSAQWLPIGGTSTPPVQ